MHTFPPLVEFDSAGRTDLRSAIADHGGIIYWAERIGLPLPAARRHGPYSTADAIRDAEQVIALLGRLPGEPTLRRMGYARLATTVRHAGGAAAFARTHQLSSPPPDPS